MEILFVEFSVLLIMVLYKEEGVRGSVLDGTMYGSRCRDIGSHIQNCTKSPNYRLVDNMPIALNATEIKLFCKDKDSILSCIEETLIPCRDSLTGILAVIYDMNVFNTTYTILCNNMELAWWAETKCIRQINTKFQECRSKRDNILTDVYRIGSTGVYCQRLEDLYQCNTYEANTVCTQQYSDYLTGFYQEMFTPTACINPYRNLQVAYKTSYDEETNNNNNSNNSNSSGCIAFLNISYMMYLFILLLSL